MVSFKCAKCYYDQLGFKLVFCASQVEWKHQVEMHEKKWTEVTLLFLTPNLCVCLSLSLSLQVAAIILLEINTRTRKIREIGSPATAILPSSSPSSSLLLPSDWQRERVRKRVRERGKKEGDMYQTLLLSSSLFLLHVTATPQFHGHHG